MVTSGRSGLLQSVSVKTWPSGASGQGSVMATIEDVSTTRLTPARLAAFSTRTAPSRAGRITSSGLRGCFSGNGEATCCTYVQPSIAVSQPSSLSRSAETNVTLLGSAPAGGDALARLVGAA